MAPGVAGPGHTLLRKQTAQRLGDVSHRETPSPPLPRHETRTLSPTNGNYTRYALGLHPSRCRLAALRGFAHTGRIGPPSFREGSRGTPLCVSSPVWPWLS